MQLHDCDFKLPWPVKEVIKQYVHECKKRWIEEDCQIRESRIIEVAWRKSNIGWCKINVVGRCSTNGEVGCGGVIRDDCGEWLGGFSMNLSGCNAQEAEMWGLVEGLQMCWELGFKMVEVE